MENKIVSEFSILIKEWLLTNTIYQVYFYPYFYISIIGMRILIQFTRILRTFPFPTQNSLITISR